MAAKFDKEALKKHHFWFLLVFVLIGLFLAWVGLFWEVPGATLATKEEQEKKQQSLKSLQGKPRALVAKYTDQVRELQKLRENMWRAAWNEQKDLYFWPAKRPRGENNPFNVLEPKRAFLLDQDSHGFSEKQLAVVANRKFGEDIPNRDGVRDQFRNPEVYEAAYRKIVGDLQPMQFRNDNWQEVLRFVPKWGQMPTSEEVWLAMEDMWIQRELLMRVHQVNLNAAMFARTADLAGALAGGAAGVRVEKPGVRTFRSRIWQLDLQLVNEGNKRVLKGTLKNVTNRLQVLGVGNVLKLKVWVNDPEKSRFFPFEIEGVSVPAGDVPNKNPLVIKPTAAHEIPDDWQPRDIFKVEQVFDARTVPVKRIEYLEIGKLSDRNSMLPMRMTPFSETAAAKDPAAATQGGTFGAPIPMSPEGPGAPGTGSEQAPATVLSGVTPQHQINRVRYIDVTGQLRRIPIGLVVVTDQTYMKDIVESIANTRMRFQTTQVEWSRFHSVLNYRSGSETGPGPGELPGGIFGGFPGRGGEGGFPGRGGEGGFPGRGGEGGFPGRGGEGGFPGPGGEGFQPSGPMFGSGYQSGGPDNSAQDQFSANMMELSVYGIISLYEKFDDPKGTPKQSTTSTSKEKEAEPVVEEPVTPMPKEKTPPVKEPVVAPSPREKMPPVKENNPKVPDPKVPDPKMADPNAKSKEPAPPAKPKP